MSVVEKRKKRSRGWPPPCKFEKCSRFCCTAKKGNVLNELAKLFLNYRVEVAKLCKNSGGKALLTDRNLPAHITFYEISSCMSCPALIELETHLDADLHVPRPAILHSRLEAPLLHGNRSPLRPGPCLIPRTTRYHGDVPDRRTISQRMQVPWSLGQASLLGVLGIGCGNGLRSGNSSADLKHATGPIPHRCHCLRPRRDLRQRRARAGTDSGA